MKRGTELWAFPEGEPNPYQTEWDDLTAAIMKILYATADGFEQVVEEEQAPQEQPEPESDLPDEEQEETY